MNYCEMCKVEYCEERYGQLQAHKWMKPVSNLYVGDLLPFVRISQCQKSQSGKLPSVPSPMCRHCIIVLLTEAGHAPFYTHRKGSIKV